MLKSDSRSAIILILMLAVPVWWFVFISSVLSRALDGGIFLSVIGGMQQGLALYSEVWDNKDPLFFFAMFAASGLNSTGLFLMDLFWIPLAALGAWLITKGHTSPSRALFVGIVASPLIVVGSAYLPGLTNTPGTALGLLAFGLVMARRGAPAGIALGLLVFTKLVIWPVVIIGVLAALVFPTFRRVVRNAIVLNVLTVGLIAGVMAVAGWFAPYLEAQQRNRVYASDVMVYFGFEPSWIGHLEKLRNEGTSATWFALAAIGAILIVSASHWVRTRRNPNSNWQVAVLWLGVAALGSMAVLAITYVWPHHVQVLALPGILAVSVLAGALPSAWSVWMTFPVLIAAAWILGAWGTPGQAADRVASVKDTFPVRWSEIDEIPQDARILASVPRQNFTYARLGTNDDRGYLLSVRPDATLQCAQFHLYDFSPAEDFKRTLECLRSVDVVLMTDNFITFGNGGKAANVQPILEYVKSNMDCLIIGDRQLCDRRL